jgi:hypothetical protein
MVTHRKERGNLPPLSPISGHPYVVGEAGLIPGFRDEPRSLLCFILRVLDGKHRQMVRQHIEYFMNFDFQVRTPDAARFLRLLHDDPTLIRHAVEGMIDAMRVMADMWIDSGKSRSDRDVDTPADRNVEDVLPGRDFSLFFMIDRALFRTHPRYTEMKRDGTQQIKDTFPRFEADSLQWRIEEALQDHGKKWAAFHFSRLLNSPDSRYISRCDHCESYFAYQRARLRTVTHGVSCPACDGKASMARTESSRAKRLDSAARSIVEWESRRKGPVQLEWVANQVNKAHGTSFGRRWVSQNFTRIQERMEALRDGERQGQGSRRNLPAEG